MALTLVVRSGQIESPPTITLDAPRIVVGRGDGCDVRLPDPSVSHRHASFRQRGADYLVIDEGSTNGTFVGRMRLSPQAPRVVRSGDLVRVGRVWLQVRLEHTPVTQHPKTATQEVALALVASALRADGQAATLKVRITEGPDAGRELVLAQFDVPYLVGRTGNAALSLLDEDASRHHLELTRRGSRLFARDLGSKNGSLLDGQPLVRDQEVAWPSSATLRIGADAFSYDDPVADALRELEQVADERMREDEPVEPPTGTDPAEDGEPAGTSDADHDESVSPPPAAARSGGTAPRPVPATGWSSTDLLVALLALVVLALSIVGIWWLFAI